MEEKFENGVEGFFESTFGALSGSGEVILGAALAVVLIVVGNMLLKRNKKAAGYTCLSLGIIAVFTDVIKAFL